jgi:CubicO group peptidase (beta-lactamase class C family)
LSLAEVHAGKVILTKGYGRASLELDAPATASTLYGLGSISKQFTATAIMLLVEEGKIGLDDRLTNYFGWLPKEWGEVTIRHLLTHTSGIREQDWKGGIIEFDRFEHSSELRFAKSDRPLAQTQRRTTTSAFFFTTANGRILLLELLTYTLLGLDRPSVHRGIPQASDFLD